MANRKCSISNSKRTLKEKVVQIYESYFRGDDIGNSNPVFWDEFFLLKPKVEHLQSEIQRISPENIALAKKNINGLFHQCLQVLSEEYNIRLAFALQTLCALVQAVYKRTCSDSAVDVIDLLIGSENADLKMEKLISHCQWFLSGDSPDNLKEQCLKLLLVFATGMEDLNRNPLIEYITASSIFEGLMQLLSNTTSRQVHGHNIVVLITLLVNYKKYEATNPYIVKLSILDDELAINGYGQIITCKLLGFCRTVDYQCSENQNVSWFSSITNIVGNIFVSDETSVSPYQSKENNSLLLALYEAIHLNRNFITTLAPTQTSSSSPPSPNNTLNSSQKTPDYSSVAEMDDSAQPSNLLVAFFQYCSIMMQDTKTETGFNTVKLCFLILNCVTEDQFANSIMHDVSLTFKVHLYYTPMRHRKTNRDHSNLSQPLVFWLLDLLVEFIMSHMMKKFPLELYSLCLGIVHRILCYQKKCCIRINYHWKNMWTSLISLLKFLVQQENSLAKKMDIFSLLLQIIDILNLFIMFGDTFLPAPGSYDELYYELIRMQSVFDNMYSLGLRYASYDGDHKDSALKLNNSLVNIRAIVKHFVPKIEQWLANSNLSTPSQEQILDVVRKNYDSLTLKLQDSLDQYERYAERPVHADFFLNVVKDVMQDVRRSLDLKNFDQNFVCKGFSSIL